MLQVVLFIALLAGPPAEDPPQRIDPADTLRAENKLLHATITKQAKEIKRLQAELERLSRRVEQPDVPLDKPEATGEPAAKDGVDVRVPRTVFVLDASGSMINAFGAAKVELLKAVRSLEPSQHFNVFMTQDDRVKAFQPTLVPATPLNVRQFAAFLDGATTSGTTNPIPALEAAFKLRPTVLWLISDGDFQDNNAVLDAIRKHNRAGTRINAVVMTPPGSDPDVSSSFVEFMHRLAEETGGTAIDSAGKPFPPRSVAAKRARPKAKAKKFSDMTEDELPAGPSIFQEHRD